MRRKHSSLYLVRIITLWLAVGFVYAADPSILTLERIFSSNEFTSEAFGPIRWLKTQPGYLCVEDSAGFDDAKDIVRYDTESGKPAILVSAQQLIPSGETTPLKIDDFSLSPREDALLIFTNTRRVWRRNTRGDYWLLELDSGRLRKLGGSAEPSMLMFAKFSPQGDRIAYIYKNDIYVQNLSDLEITRLTTDGSATMINGTFDWVYEEEFHLRDGYRWSPDGRHIAFWQLDSSQVRQYPLINHTDSLYPTIKLIPYPKAGQTNSAGRVGIVSAAAGPIRWLETPGDPRNHYIARLEWAPDSGKVVLQYLNRLQNTNHVLLGDIVTGKVRKVFTDQSDTWVEVCDDFTWLQKGKRFLFVSERDGWQHVYRVSRADGTAACITPGAFDVIRIAKVDEKNNWIYYMAAPKNPTQRYLFRTRLDGRGKPERLTPLEQPGTHGYNMAPDSRWAIHTHSSFGSPPTVDLIRLPGHQRIRPLAENRDLKKKVAALKRTPVEFFQVDTEKGVTMDCWCLKPPDFDPAKKYPLLFYVYGEPWGQTVRDSWDRNYLWHLMLTQHGYLVMSVDNRGTASPRGSYWRHCIYGKVGILASRDQAAALKAIKKRFAWVDGSRVGIWGWSGGGSMSLNMIFRYPELYHTAMAVAFVANQRYYDSIYQERYMGLPATNPVGYKQGSPITFAHRLQGNLLLVHGTGDDNVHYQNCEALVNQLVAHNKPFTMMAYPNRSHGIREGKNTTLHLFTLLTRFLEKNLPPDRR